MNLTGVVPEVVVFDDDMPADTADDCSTVLDVPVTNVKASDAAVLPD